MHVIVIGAGAIGLSSALSLAQAGCRVTLLDRGPAGGESTWAGAGILSSLPPWAYGPEVNTLIQRGCQLWPQWAERLKSQSGIDPEYLPSGMLVLDVADKAPSEQWCREHGWASAEPPAALSRFVPRSDRAIWLPQVGQLRNPRLTQALHGTARALGVEVKTDHAVFDLVREDGRIVAAKTEQGIFQADRFVLAAGAWTQTLLGDDSSGLDIRPVRGQILLYKAEPGLLPCIVYRDGHYLVPRADGHILAGSTLEEAGFDKRTTEAAHDELSQFTQSVLPELDPSTLVRQWAGLRPGSPQNIPTIARHPCYDNLYVNSGHFRYGVTMAPASAEILTQLITGSGDSVDPHPFAWPNQPSKN